MIRLLLTRPLPAKVEDAARARFDLTCRPDTQPMTRDEISAALDEYDAIIPTLGDVFDRQSLSHPKRCKILANFGVGYNHIDVAAAHQQGVVVTNTPGAVTDATADIAMTLVLMTSRRASEGERLVRAGAWQGWHPTQLLGLHVTGKRLGIVGMGRIGQAVARRAHLGFDMEIGYFNRSPKKLSFAAQRHDKLETLLAWSDIVVIAVPGGADTRHLIDGTALTHMRPHAVLVNVARGDVIDESALIDALSRLQIAGAGLDVYEKEPEVPAALCALENVTLLPHLGTAALEVRERMGLMALQNVIDWAEGRAPGNAIALN